MKKCKVSIIGLVCCLMLCLGMGSAVAFEFDVEMNNNLAKFVKGTKAKDWTKMTVTNRLPLFFDEGVQAFSINEKNMTFLNQDAGPFNKLEVYDKDEILLDNLTFINQAINGQYQTVYNVTYWVYKDNPKVVFVTKMSVR